MICATEATIESCMAHNVGDSSARILKKDSDEKDFHHYDQRISANGVDDFADGETWILARQAQDEEDRENFKDAPAAREDAKRGFAHEEVSSIENLEQAFRSRSTSISFNPIAKSDHGHQKPVRDTSPRSGLPMPRRSRSMLQELNSHRRDRTRSASGHSFGSRPFAVLPGSTMSSPTDQAYRQGQSRYPLLQETVDELALEAGPENIYLSRQEGPNPFIWDGNEIAITPQSLPQDYGSSSKISHLTDQIEPLSSRPEKNPLRIDPFWSQNHGNEPESIMRRVSRKSSGKSSSSVHSPASAFLSLFNHTSPTSEPDDEGQMIGENNEYVIGKQVGFGGFSVIKELSCMDAPNVCLAVKIVRKNVSHKSELANDEFQLRFAHEVAIWKLVEHVHILPLVHVFQNDWATYCITRLTLGGTLFDLLRRFSKTAYPLGTTSNDSTLRPGIPLHLIKRYIKQLALAIQYLHEEKRLVHGDIKLENCLLDNPLELSAEPSLLLCDFGMAGYNSTGIPASISTPLAMNPCFDGQESPSNIGPSESSTSVAGSLEYASPELIRASGPLHLPSVDIWAFGVVCFALLVGSLPFSHDLMPMIRMMIEQGNWNTDLVRNAFGDKYNDSNVNYEAEAAIELVRGCIEVDVTRRWSIGDVQACSFLRSFLSE